MLLIPGKSSDWLIIHISYYSMSVAGKGHEHVTSQAVDQDPQK